MANLPPVSPSAVTSADLPPASDAPISPVARSDTFAHKTSPAVSTQTPLINTNTPAINAAPVEIDGAALSPEDLKRRTTAGSSGVFSPADEDDIEAEFLGEGAGAGREAREKRAAMLANRSKDPGVIVDVPQDPTAEEVEAAKSADGVTTPGLERERIPGGLGGR